jgi:hypothetical protein
MIERAGSDRVLFAQSRPQEHVNMRFPEYVPMSTLTRGRAHVACASTARVWRVCCSWLTFGRIMNQGSPFNVPAGQVNNMEKVIEKFKKDAYEDNERKLQALRDNNIKSEQPWERYPENQRGPAKGVASV